MGYRPLLEEIDREERANNMMEMYLSGYTPKEICKKFSNISRATFYREVREFFGGINNADRAKHYTNRINRVELERK